MATMLQTRVRPRSSDDFRTPSRPRTIGLVLALVGATLAAVTLIANLVAAGDPSVREATLPWSFGLTTTAFGMIKLGIAVVLWGILIKLWLRVDSIKEALGRLVTVDGPVRVGSGTERSEYGTAIVSETPPDDLPIHRMARRLWAPMLVMGAMSVVAGLVTSFAWAGGGSTVSSAWTQGLQFLGEGFLLSGISFLLGTILWAIRTGGAEVQSNLGVAVKTLRMPAAAKGFIVLMMLGLIVSVAQFVLYLVVAGGAVSNTAAWFALLGPLREFGLALILSGIALALVAIGTALGFQFRRVVELVAAGRRGDTTTKGHLS